MLTLKIGDIVWPKNDSDPYKWLVIDFRGYETPEGHRANIQFASMENGSKYNFLGLPEIPSDWVVVRDGKVIQ